MTTVDPLRNASVTMSMREYRRLSDGLHMGGVAFIACAAFGVGVIVGMTSLHDDAPSSPRPAVVQTQLDNSVNIRHN